MANTKKRSTVADWKKISRSEFDVELPSGHVVLARKMKPEAFLSSGSIPDPLANMIQKAIRSKKGLPPAQIEDKLVNDPQSFGSIMEMMDRVFVYCVIEPDVEMPPPCCFDIPGSGICNKYYTDSTGVHTDRNQSNYHRYQEDARDEQVLYADEVELQDKLHIFQHVLGGIEDIKSFRTEPNSNVGDVPAGKNVQSKAKRTSGSK